MTLVLKTHPAEEPVTLDEIRQQMGIRDPDDTARDAIITARITSARRWAEQHCRRAFVTQTWTLYADAFADTFDLMADLQSISSVKYRDNDGILQTLDAGQYLADTVNSRLYPAYGVSWPGTREQYNAVQIEHISGYGAASFVPMDIKEAILFIVGHWENYQASIEGVVRVSTIPYAVTQLLSPYVDLRNSF
jgi:uncharacterized phiE125 gp8 family phage protein